LVNNIELTFITKDEFNGLVSDFNNFKKILKSELKTKDVKKVSQKKNRTNWEISKDAEANFEKKHYTDAIRDYEYLIKQNFKPAYSHYMIGEMKFRRKDYAEAIAYFKKSAELYSKAKYMPSLMLHTAMAMEATGDIKNAKAFYNAIASSYPDTKEATVALKNLESMK
jgi:tetratricopeptide (TPR) repeat protein